MATILIVDDQSANRAFLVTLLRHQGHRLLEAADGREGLTAVQAEHPDLVITDVLMPGVDGYEFVKQLRLDPAISGIPVVFYTAHYGGREARALARSSGVTDVLTKPAESAEVLKVVDRVLAGGSAALVRLGPYSAITDEGGDYRFTRVPDGQFELALDKNKLPAAYASDEKPRPLTVTRGSRERVDLQVIPLNTIRGRVCVDRDRNAYCDEDEGVPNAVVAVNGSVTATSATGSYAFYNQPPGRYKIRLDVQRLPRGLAPASPAERDIELTVDYPLLGVDFTVEKKDMPIIMREIPR